MLAGYARGGDGGADCRASTTCAGSNTVPLRFSVRGTRASGARTQEDARGGGAGPSPHPPNPLHPHLTFPQHMLYNNK